MTSGWPDPTIDGTTTVTGHSMYYRICGPADARETILCVHGGPGATHDYLQPLSDLARRGYRVVFFDQLGCGNSERITDTALFSLEHHIAEIHELRDRLDLGSVHLFGSSYGGTLVLAYALEHPAGIHSLVTAGGLASVPLAVREMQRWIDGLPPATREVLRRGEATGEFTTPEYEAAVQEFYRRHVCRLAEWPEPVRYSFAAMSGPVYGHMNGPNEFTIVGTIRTIDLSPRLGEIRIPTLVTGGRYDEVSPLVAQQIADGLPESELALFEHSSHLPFWEERGPYIDRVATFLERVRRRRGA